MAQQTQVSNFAQPSAHHHEKVQHFLHHHPPPPLLLLSMIEGWRHRECLPVRTVTRCFTVQQATRLVWGCSSITGAQCSLLRVCLSCTAHQSRSSSTESLLPKLEQSKSVFMCAHLRHWWNSSGRREKSVSSIGLSDMEDTGSRRSISWHQCHYHHHCTTVPTAILSFSH